MAQWKWHLAKRNLERVYFVTLHIYLWPSFFFLANEGIRSHDSQFSVSTRFCVYIFYADYMHRGINVNTTVYTMDHLSVIRRIVFYLFSLGLPIPDFSL